MDSTGNPLSFSKESGIELAFVRQGQDGVWQQAPFPRGDDVHVVLGRTCLQGQRRLIELCSKMGLSRGKSL